MIRRWIASLAVLCVFGSPPAAGAQSSTCPMGTISQIDVRNHSIFAPEEIARRRFGWALRFANRAHFRTRSDFIKRTIFLSEGGCYDPEALAASLRVLRDLNIIARAEGDARRAPDSTWVVQVRTWDEWSTHTAVDANVDRVLRFEGFSVNEINALGRGLSLAFSYRSLRERRDLSVALASTRFAGTSARASVTAGSTRTGHFFRGEVVEPFLREESPIMLLARYEYEDRQYSWFTGNFDGLSNVLLPLADRRVVLVAQRRRGVPGALSLLGGELALLRRTVSGPPRQVVRGQFDDPTDAPDTLAARLRSQANPPSSLRVGPTIGFRRVRHTEGRGLDLVSGTQDVALGSDLTVHGGHSLLTWGGPTARAHSYLRADGFMAGMRGPLVVTASAHAEGRYLDAPSAGLSRWRDVIANGRGLVYARVPGRVSQTFVVGTRVDLRHAIDQPWQTPLGSETGGRGYNTDEVPTGSTVIGFAEDRINLPVMHPAVDLGFTAFTDYARGWAGDIPFARNTGWRPSAGGGLRIGFPASSGAIARIDLAWPFGDTSGHGRGPVLRVIWSSIMTGR